MKIQLKHPAGKKAISMDSVKYNQLKELIIRQLTLKGPLTHTEILQYVLDEFNKNNTTFEGSVEWHMEWIKLDLEAGNTIERIKNTSPIKFSIVKQKV